VAALIRQPSSSPCNSKWPLQWRRAASPRPPTLPPLRPCQTKWPGRGRSRAGCANARPPANYGQFANNAGGNRWASNSQVEAPSRYQLRAGFVIPGTLISGINSQIPGQIVAQVSQNVFDTATGRYLLIPQGSRLVGAYDSNPVFGQTRALIAWQRIIFPDGKAIDLGAMPGRTARAMPGSMTK
jgi:type IV secretion system protein VirB10